MNTGEQQTGRHPFCLQCGYDLFGLEAGACPECGRRFDPTDPSSYRFAPRQRVRSLVLAVVGIHVFLFPIVVLRPPRPDIYEFGLPIVAWILERLGAIPS